MGRRLTAGRAGASEKPDTPPPHLAPPAGFGFGVILVAPLVTIVIPSFQCHYAAALRLMDSMPWWTEAWADWNGPRTSDRHILDGAPILRALGSAY